MSVDEALTLIRESVHWQKAGGDPVVAWTRYKKANPVESERLVLGEHPFATKYAQGMGYLLDYEPSLVGVFPTTLAAPTPTPPPVKRIKGAMVVNATAASPDLFRRAGITHVAVEMNGPNLVDLRTARWDGFVRGGMFISRGGDTHNEVPHVATIADDALLGFVVVDTECHKADMGGSMDWTERLYAGLRSELGLGYPLVNVTFGIHSSPAVVNHDALRRHNVKAIWETYGGDGATLGVEQAVMKAVREGWVPPHLALGDKSLRAEVGEIVGKQLAVGDVWVWAGEQSGESILELAKVPVG